jgi:hypothetical protein
MKRMIGCEVGNYDTKLMTREAALIGLIESKGGKQVDEAVVMNVLNAVAPAKERRSLGVGNRALSNLLDVTIETHEKAACGRWFVGGLAHTEGTQIFKPTREDEKASNPMTIVMLLTTLAFALYDPAKAKQKEVVSLATLLPTEEYFKDGLVEAFVAKIKGEHKVKFHDAAFKGAEVVLKIDGDIELLPEGAAGQTATTFDWNGEPFDPSYITKTIVNIDIGSIDTDISVMQDGDFVSKGFFGIKGGTTDVLRSIAAEINERHSYKIDTHKLDYHIRSKKPLYIGTRHIEDLDSMASKHYDQHAWHLSNRLTEELKDKAIDKQALHEVNLIGGGPEFYEKGFKQHFESPYMSIVVPSNARFKNVEGALKSLMMRGLDAVEGEVFQDK